MLQPPTTLPGTRLANRARVLRLIHRDGPQSRAALTAATGLNRSTIQGLVADLVDDGLVIEGAPDASARAGRPSPVISASPDNVTIAVNPEVDAVEIAAIGLDRSIRVRERLVVPSAPTADQVVTLVAHWVAEQRAGELSGARILSVGVAVPGLVRASDGLIRNAPHLGWRDVVLAAPLAEATGARAFVGNDATLGTLAEHLFGAARGAADVIYLNGGASGIGGGLIVRGMPVTGASGFAGEFGQNRPRISAGADQVTADGVLEDEVNRARLLASLGLNAADDDTLALALSASTETAVADEIARQCRVLASALANAVNVLNPAVVVLGGFLGMLAALAPTTLQSEVAHLAMSETAEELQIRPAALGADRLLIGAAELAFGELLESGAMA